MKLYLTGLFLIFLAVCAVGAQVNAPATAKTNKPAPPFEVTSLTGKTFKLEDLKGKYVVLNFWFIHCPPCLKEIPKLNQLVTAYGKGNFVFIAFALDNKYELESFLKQKPFTYNIIPKGLPMALKYNTEGTGRVAFPTHVVIDPNGDIEFRSEGSEGLGPLQKELKRLAALK
jgi:peroxiredoxin